MKVRPKKIKGQAILEVVIAMGLAAILGVALLTAVLATQKASINSRNNSQAAKLAQEHIENVRTLRDYRGIDYLGNYSAIRTDWDFSSTPCEYLNMPSSLPTQWNLLATSPNCTSDSTTQVVLNGTTFTRQIQINYDTTLKVARVLVTVTWMEPAGSRQVTDSTVLANW